MYRPYDLKIPEKRLFLLGDCRANSQDSGFHLAEQGGTVSVNAVRGRVTDDRTVPALLGAALLFGGVVVLSGIGLGVGALAARRRKAPTVQPASWPVQPG
ncbi:hypothetical protein [Streptomyces sp. NPDC007905]|uniref:hypothetical protein n=1 Tax=Streptomyces sp. NPDC007905 TaxID=3364788 RepID=UPI0036EA836C